MTNNCKNTLSMTKWLQEETDEVCRSCLLGPIIQWYESELKEQNKPSLAKKLQNVREKENPSPIEIAQTMDDIKKSVSPELKKRLKEFDCETQTYEKSNRKSLSNF